MNSKECTRTHNKPFTVEGIRTSFLAESCCHLLYRAQNGTPPREGGNTRQKQRTRGPKQRLTGSILGLSYWHLHDHHLKTSLEKVRSRSLSIVLSHGWCLKGCRCCCLVSPGQLCIHLSCTAPLCIMNQCTSLVPRPLHQSAGHKSALPPRPAQTYDRKVEPQEIVDMDIFTEMEVHWWML